MIKEASKYSSSWLGNESGNITFYLIFVLPIVLILLVIVVDISIWQQKRILAQNLTDSLVMEAARSLPFAAHAKGVIDKSIAAHISKNVGELNLQTDTDVYVNESEVSLLLRGEFTSFFSGIFETTLGSSLSFPFEVKAVAKLQPVDAVLIVSDAFSLRPPAETAWGDESDWPASPYFLQMGPAKVRISPPPAPPEAYRNWWEDSVFHSVGYQRWATQLCFNPATIPLKRAGVLVIDRLLPVVGNRLAVFSTPGDASVGPGYSVLSDFSYAKSDARQKPGAFSSYFEPNALNSDEACLYQAHPDLGASPYSIPPPIETLSEDEYCSEVFSENPLQAEGHFPNPLSTKLSPCYQSSAPLRDRFYYHAIRMHPHEVKNANIVRTIIASIAYMRSVNKDDANEEILERGAFAGRSQKVIMLLSDTIPDSAQMTEVLRKLNENDDIRLEMFVLQHGNLSENIASLNFAASVSYSGSSETRVQVLPEGDYVRAVKNSLDSLRRVVLKS